MPGLFDGKRILITGGTGSLGQVLTAHFAEFATLVRRNSPPCFAGFRRLLAGRVSGRREASAHPLSQPVDDHVVREPTTPRYTACVELTCVGLG
jgi:NAD(P)-dependent dehydrogenase (short-subunit alcohol dehydrogenase family)